MARDTGKRVAQLVQALPPALSPHTRIRAALAELEPFGDEYALVGTQRRPCAALARADIERAARFGLERWTLEELMVGELPCVTSNATVRRASAALRRTVSPLVVVLDALGQPMGCLSRTVLERHLAQVTHGAAVETRNLSARLPSEQRELLREIGRSSPQGAWLVGGVVRDLLLGRAIEDVDVAIAGDIEPAIEALGGKVRSHERFGTGTLERHGLRLDLAETRRESYSAPAALPVVERAELDTDLFRRDFTVNALAIALDPEDWGRLVDLYGGRHDLECRRLRVLHGLSFMDDPTRAFRAARLAARLGFTVDPRTRRAIERAIATGVVDRLTPVRLLRELRLALDEGPLARVVLSLERHGLLASVKLARGPAGNALLKLPSVLEWYESVGGSPPVEQWIVALGLLLPAAPARVLSRLDPPRAERAALEEIAKQARTLKQRLARPRTRSATWRICRDLRPSTWIAALASGASPAARRAIVLHVSELRNLRLAIDGHDLERAGVAPGPAIARGLEAARSAMLDGRAPDAGSQLRMALRRARPS